MDKIICSLEEWDSIIDYYRPNGSSKTWYLKEFKRLNRPTMWGDWNIFSEQMELFDNGMFRGIITPDYSKDIQYTPINEVGDSPHLYIINIWNLHFFVENIDIGFQCVTEKYLNDVREGKAKIIMIYLFEGYSGSYGNQDFEIIEKWRIESGLPNNSIYFICANLICEEIIKQRGYGFIAKPTHSFEPWNRYDEEVPVDFKPTHNKYLFLSYNRNPRPQRLIFLSHLLDNQLFDKGMISLNKLRNPIPPNLKLEHLEFFHNNTPFVIDEKYDLDYNLAVNITKEDYENTFISLVTESLADDGTLFFSEKIWKPLMVGHPFLLYGNQHSLRYLKNLGYKTFDKWIDESYDDEPDAFHRSLKVVEEVRKLSLKSMEELHQIRNEMKETCEFNQKKYKELYFKKYGDDGINREIESVIKEAWENLINKN